MADHRAADWRRLGHLFLRCAEPGARSDGARSLTADALLFIGLFTATTYLLAGWAREQVCTYMCPWPRFQSAMVDRDTLTVTYRSWRGEPRGKIKKGGLLRFGIGDCIDCRSCVAVCPTGIDIRDGLQLQCIGCGLCIDSCDEVMHRIGRPAGLIAFTSKRMHAAALQGGAADAVGALRRALLRPRTAVYSALLIAGSAVMLGTLMSRGDVALSVLADRSPLYVTLSDGSVRNGYTVKISNKTPETRRYRLTAAGLPGLRLTLPELGDEAEAADGVESTVTPDSIGAFRVLLRTRPGAVQGEAPVSIALRPSDRTGPGIMQPGIMQPGIVQSATFHGPVK